MGMRKFGSAALPFSKVACVVKGSSLNCITNSLLRAELRADVQMIVWEIVCRA
jgi:uncharacterized metal-binding protein